MNRGISYFVTAIDTDSGKTLVSAILCEVLRADYWKPVQCGEPKDSDVIKNLVSYDSFSVHPETWYLKQASSPHAAAIVEGVEISLTDFQCPETKNALVIEGAGGVLVPLNDQDLVIDLICKLKAQVILVADLYLGSINHTLLTIEALKARNISIAGIIFNGPENYESERIILKHSNLRKLLHLEKEEVVNREVVLKYAKLLKSVL